MEGSPVNASLRLLAIVLVALMGTLTLTAQPERRIVPRHPLAIHLPELGRITGLPEDCALGGEMYSVGDVNGDSIGDWVASRKRCDTVIDGKMPEELLLYKGVRGGLPTVIDRLRIGPSELGARTKFMAAGDWDADGYADICTSISIYSDTTRAGRTGIQLSSMVVWWGNEEGNYSLDDTTRLEIGALDGWLRPNEGFSQDLDYDGVVDLVIVGIAGYSNGEKIATPSVQAWFGSQGERWRGERERLSDWGWWSWPGKDHHQLIDQDADGLMDLIFHYEGGGGGVNGSIKIIYGKPEVILDTANIVEIRLDSAWGKRSRFMDITGDEVPELVLNTGGQEALKVYVGFKGQRLQEQYGLGNEPSHPGQPIWWGKPWAVVPLPGQLHDGWAAAGWSNIYDIGDANLDGLRDIWVVTVPDAVCYTTGYWLDSLYEAWIAPQQGAFGGATLENIDGSGKWTHVAAARYDGVNTLHFYQPSADVPSTGEFRQLPPGTDKVTSSVDERSAGSNLNLRTDPNPASGEVVIRWNGEAKKRAVVTITDALGQPVTTLAGEEGSESIVWDASETFGGVYHITITVGEQTETTRVVIQR